MALVLDAFRVAVYQTMAAASRRKDLERPRSTVRSSALGIAAAIRDPLFRAAGPGAVEAVTVQRTYLSDSAMRTTVARSRFFAASR